MTQPQHDDPVGEARAQLLQGLAVLSTVGEAGARWVAVGMQKRAADAEAAAKRDEAARAAQQEADDLQEQEQRAGRERIERGLTDWLEHADLADTARLWRTAAVYAAAGNPDAKVAVGLAQDRMRRIHPPFMAAYDRLRADGVPEVDAMRRAAREVWETEAHNYRPPHANGRPQPGREPEQLAAGANGRSLPGGPGMLDDLDRAVREEAGRLAEHISPEALNALQVSWRNAGNVPAADAAGLLAQYAQDAAERGAMPRTAADALAASLRQRGDREAEAASRESGQADLPDTATVDEHTDGQRAATADRDAAAHDQATAAAAAQQDGMRAAFPGPPRPGAIVAGKRPATVVAGPAQTQARGRGRS